MKDQSGTTVPETAEIPRPEPIGQDRRGQDEYFLNELIAYRMSRGVTVAQMANYLGMGVRSLVRFEQDSKGTGRTADTRCRDYLLGVEKYDRARGVMAERAKGRWRSAAEARALLDAQRAEEDAPGFRRDGMERG